MCVVTSALYSYWTLVLSLGTRSHMLEGGLRPSLFSYNVGGALCCHLCLVFLSIPSHFIGGFFSHVEGWPSAIFVLIQCWQGCALSPLSSILIKPLKCHWVLLLTCWRAAFGHLFYSKAGGTLCCYLCLIQPLWCRWVLLFRTCWRAAFGHLFLIQRWQGFGLLPLPCIPACLCPSPIIPVCS